VDTSSSTTTVFVQASAGVIIFNCIQPNHMVRKSPGGARTRVLTLKNTDIVVEVDGHTPQFRAAAEVE